MRPGTATPAYGDEASNYLLDRLALYQGAGQTANMGVTLLHLAEQTDREKVRDFLYQNLGADYVETTYSTRYAKVTIIDSSDAQRTRLVTMAYREYVQREQPKLLPFLPGNFLGDLPPFELTPAAS